MTSAGLIAVLKKRFLAHPERHLHLDWSVVEARLKKYPKKMKSLEAMEDTGGEPDVVAFDAKTGELTFFDCSPESPSGRRSLCYDAAALTARKENKPKSSAEACAQTIGIEMLNEDQYQYLQTFGAFDCKTSSWVKTPESIRRLGGAIFCYLRFGRVFTYHNGAESYYAARGFRGWVKV